MQNFVLFEIYNKHVHQPWYLLSFASMSNESPIDKDWHNSDYEIKEQDRFLPIANGMYYCNIEE